MKKILIAGGTGLIGRSLSEFFLDKKYSVTIISRNEKLKLKNQQNLKYITNVKEGVFDYDIVINLTGETIAQRWNESTKKKIIDSRINSTREIIEAINKSDQKPELFINSSAIGYYGTSENTSFDEYSAPKNLNIFSQLLCQKIETESVKISPDVRLVILRTGVVISKNGGFLKKMLLPFKLGLGGRIGNGRQFLSWIHIKDVVGSINHIIGNKKIKGAINLTAPNPVTNQEFSTALAKKLKRPCFFNMPVFVARLLFGQMGEELILNGQKVLPKKLSDSNYQFEFASIANALSHL